jgi:DNA-directed RNA polymerase specialized sigma24 family protein
MTAIEDVGEPSLPSGLSVEAIDVNIAMAKLPRGQRQSLEAKYYDDFSGAEIAVAMNATEMAVYGQLARARGALRVLLPSYVRRRQAKPRVGSQRRRNSHANDRKTEN